MSNLTVGHLREALVRLPNDAEISIQVTDSEGILHHLEIDTVQATINGVAVHPIENQAILTGKITNHTTT